MSSQKPAGRRRVLSDRVAQATSLEDLRVRQIDAKLLAPSSKPPIEPKLTVEPKAGQFERFAVYDYNYELKAMDARNVEVFSARTVWNLVFRITRDGPLSQDELEAFGAIGGIEIAHPYVRELMHSLTLRMGLPGFVLEVNPPILDSKVDRASAAK